MAITPEDLQRDIKITSAIPYNKLLNPNTQFNAIGCRYESRFEKDGFKQLRYATEYCWQEITIKQDQHRIIGLITGTNADGTHQISLMGNNINYRDVATTYRSAYFGQGFACDLIEGAGDSWNAEVPASVRATKESATLYLNYIDKYILNNDNDGVLSQSGANFNGRKMRPYDNIEKIPSRTRKSISDMFMPEKYLTNSNDTTITDWRLTTDKTTSVKFGILNDKRLKNGEGFGSATHVFVDNWLIKDGIVNARRMVMLGNMEAWLSNRYNAGAGVWNATPHVDDGYLSNGCGEGQTFVRSEQAFGITYTNLLLTTNEQAAIDYINNGTIPSDAKFNKEESVDTYDVETDKPSREGGEPEPPEPPEKQIANDANDIEASSKANYSNNGTSVQLTGMNWYYIEKSILEGFIHWFWYDMVDDWSALIFNTLTGLYGDLQNAVISIKKMNIDDKFLFDVLADTNNIKLARYTYSAPTAGNYLQLIDKGVSGIVDVGDISLTDVNSIYNFLKYAPYTTISLYMPYIGIVPLDTRFAQGNTLHVKCAASYETGEIYYEVQVDGAVVGSYVGNAGINVPFSLQSSLDMGSKFLGNVANAGVGVATGGALMGATNLLGQNISTPINNNTSVNSALNKYGPTKCALIIQTPQYYKSYDTSQGATIASYAHERGYKYNCIRRFSIGDGYAVFEDPHIDNWQTSPTSAELEEIYSLMKEGIVL